MTKEQAIEQLVQRGYITCSHDGRPFSPNLRSGGRLPRCWPICPRCGMDVTK